MSREIGVGMVYVSCPWAQVAVTSSHGPCEYTWARLNKGTPTLGNLDKGRRYLRKRFCFFFFLFISTWPQFCFFSNTIHLKKVAYNQETWCFQNAQASFQALFTLQLLSVPHAQNLFSGTISYPRADVWLLVWFHVLPPVTLVNYRLSYSQSPTHLRIVFFWKTQLK